MDFWVWLGGFSIRDGFYDLADWLLLLVLLLLSVNEKAATDFEGAWHVKNVCGEEDVVDVGDVEI